MTKDKTFKFCTQCNKVVDYNNLMNHLGHPLKNKTFNDMYWEAIERAKKK